MKFLITGDLQINQFRPFATVLRNGMNSRLANCLKVLRILRVEALRRGIKNILINGDVFEHSDYIEVETYDATYRELEKIHDAGIKTVFNLGNHDVQSQFAGRILHALRAFRKVAHIVEKPTLVWGCVQIVPWIPSVKKFKQTLLELKASKEHCLVLHHGVQGAVTGPKNYLVRNPVKLEDLRPDEWGLILLSDYHSTQWLRKNVLYLGSPLQHSFGEIHRPCIWEVSL